MKPLFKDKDNKSWHIKTMVTERLEERGASFLEEKFIAPMVKDSIALKKDEPERSTEGIVKEVVDYYLSEIFKAPEESHVVQDAIAEHPHGEEDIAGVRQPQDASKSIGDGEKVACSLCGKEYKVLYPHLLAKHHLTPEQYRQMFPNAPLRSGVKEKQKKKNRKDVEEKLSQGNLKNRIIRLAETLSTYE
jgi:hypothetical protein